MPLRGRVYTPAPVAPHALNEGLLGWWLGLPELSGGGKLHDLFANGSGTGTLTYGPGWGVMPNGFACNTFTGAENAPSGLYQCVAIPALALREPANRITVSAYVYPTGWQSAGSPYLTGVFGNYNTAGNNLPILRYGDATSGNYNKLSFYVTAGGTGAAAYATTTTPLNQWSHVAGVYDGSHIYLYQNGQQIGVAVASGSLQSGTDQWAIGEDFVDGVQTSRGQSRGFIGSIGDVRLYNRALSPAEIGGLYQQARTGYPDVLARRPSRIVVPLSGVGATTYTLNGAPASASVTGAAATTVVTANGAVGSGSVTGAAATTVVTANGGPGTVTGTGTAATTVTVLTGAPQTYALTGTAAGLVVGYVLAGAPSSAAATGVAATTVAVLDGGPGAVTGTYYAAALVAGGTTVLNGAPGAAAVTGAAATTATAVTGAPAALVGTGNQTFDVLPGTGTATGAPIGTALILAGAPAATGVTGASAALPVAYVLGGAPVPAAVTGAAAVGALGAPIAPPAFLASGYPAALVNATGTVLAGAPGAVAAGGYPAPLGLVLAAGPGAFAATVPRGCASILMASPLIGSGIM